MQIDFMEMCKGIEKGNNSETWGFRSIVITNSRLWWRNKIVISGPYRTNILTVVTLNYKEQKGKYYPSKMTVLVQALPGLREFQIPISSSFQPSVDRPCFSEELYWQTFPMLKNITIGICY